VQRRIESAIALERFVMGGGPRSWDSGDSPVELVAEVEGHLRALLRDVLCGYLDSDLKGVADDILLETNPEPFMEEIQARDLRQPEPEPDPEPEPVAAPLPEPVAAPLPEPPPASQPRANESNQDTAEIEAVAPEPEPEPITFEPDLEPVAVQPQLDGVTQSADWGFDDPEDYSAPV
jgi:hypothetical protein